MLKWLDPGQIAGALLLAGVLVVIGAILSGIVRRLLAAALRHDQSERIDEITLAFLSRLTILVLWLLPTWCRRCTNWGTRCWPA